jgi:hypothetical protein
VHFAVEHDLPAAPVTVAALLCDPAFHQRHQLPDLAIPDVVDSSADGSSCLLRLRYEYTGQLDPIARRVIGSRKLTWLQDVALDADAGKGSITFSAEADPGRLFGEAAIVLATDGGDASKLSIDGDLHVKFPLIGGRAEKAIVPGLVRRFQVMTDALETELTPRG